MAQDSCGSSPAPSKKPDVAEEFQFLLCENCHQEVGFPKLLPCLHNICTGCLQETKPVNCCPVCKAPHSQTDMLSIQDNFLFMNLRDKLIIFQMIKSGQELVCENCKKEGMYWCANCQEFMCSDCFESHQRYLKRESHEALAVKDLQTNSSQEFLSQFKNITIMFCSNTEHRMENLSIYCKACQRPMCCICAVLDSKHNGHHCHIREEIERRQQELLSMSTELKEKKTSYDKTCSNLRETVNHMVEARNAAREQIQKKVAEMIQLVQETGEKLLADLEEQHQREVQDTEEKLQNAECVAQRMGSCKQLVEKMHLYASDQEVMDMYPFIRESLEVLKRKQPPVVETQMQVGNFAEVEAQLQAFYERVTEKKEAPPASIVTASNQEPLGKSPAKRKNVRMGSTSQVHVKLIKMEDDDREWKQTDGQVNLEQPGTSSGDYIAGNEVNLWRAEDPEITSGFCFSVASSETSDTDDSGCLKNYAENVSSDDIEPLGPFRDTSQNDYWRDVFCLPQQLFSGQGSLVYFDLKVLPGNVIDLAALTDETNEFSFRIQPLFSSPRGDVTGSHCAIELESFLFHLLTLHQPILVGFNLWSMDFPVLVSSLEATNKEEVFKAAVFGFLDALPLIKEKVPDLTSYTLRSLDNVCLEGELDYSKTVECAKAVKKLCTVLEVNPEIDRIPVITYSSFQSYASLQPLLEERLLSHATTQTLALHNVSLSTLLSVYQKDPACGLQKFARFLNPRRINGGKPIEQLSRARAYFKVLLSPSWGLASVVPKYEMCSSHQPGN